MRPLNIIKYQLKKHLTGYCLDAGCGDCRHMKFMENPIGIDLYKVFEKSNDKIMPMDLNRQLNFTGERFDTILCSHVLEHLKSSDFTLQEFRRILKQDGKLVIGVPNRNCIWHDFNNKKEHPGHLTKWDCKKLRGALEKNNFEIFDGPYTNYPFGGKIMFHIFNHTPIKKMWDDCWYVAKKTKTCTKV